MEKISQDKFWAIYETLPNSLKDVIFSEDTADAIWNICKLNDIENASSVAKIVGRVLMGLLPPKMLIAMLQDELSMSDDVSKKIGMEIEHFIFNAIKKELDALYEENGNTEEEKIEKKINNSEKSDSYRESLK
ncbi:MAG: hypothetical protein U9Q96_02675 [Patescibacteria group bacterium]|nr:hypothetical protein [Patescibacteria group bacterium]